ncbi:MAG: Asp-tRNA(Asn)/Glu-tRNA(Gln) amidotransferase subunit GatA [Phycisphaerales bacterium]|nr:Asp-tRNA(Asn)/Glu-tRNA(Gln) amidotransferase subunit GatA [Phycisphaerales bacterium]
MKTISETIASVQNGDVSAQECVAESMQRISTERYNAFRECWSDTPPNDAEGELSGVTIGVKDNIVTKLGTTTCGSKMLAGYQSPFDATVIDRLHARGATCVGKTNCDEFAMGSSTEHCAWGAVQNPWDTTRVPGGSSGGSAAAVASGLCHAALGSDTGGSIRQPAALCGIVGYKPTYGLVSRYGLVAFASSLDQIGVFTRSVEDAAIVSQVFAGFDPKDATSTELEAPDLTTNIHKPISGFKIGVPRNFLSDRNDPEVNAAITQAIQTYESLGATIVAVDLPLTDVGISTYYVIAPAEASSNLARYDGIRYGHRTTENNLNLFDLYAKSRTEGFGDEVKRRIMLGTYVLSSGYYDAYYNNALKVRRLICEEYARAFTQCDLILGPTTPTPAFKLGAKKDPISMYLCDFYTANTNIAGICGISIPCGFALNFDTPLPIGLHLQGPAFADAILLQAANAFQQVTQFHLRKPESSL